MEMMCVTSREKPVGITPVISQYSNCSVSDSFRGSVNLSLSYYPSKPNPLHTVPVSLCHLFSVRLLAGSVSGRIVHDLS